MLGFGPMIHVRIMSGVQVDRVIDDDAEILQLCQCCEAD